MCFSLVELLKAELMLAVRPITSSHWNESAQFFHYVLRIGIKLVHNNLIFMTCCFSYVVHTQEN